MRIRYPVTFIAALVFAMGNVVASHAVSTTDFPQTTADPPVAVPPTTPCNEVVMTHDFAFSYGAPFVGTHTPPAACPAPWSKVVMTFTASVGGVQFDRLLDVYIGGVNMMSGSTSEPCCTPGAVVHWTVQKDVSEYEPVLASAQQVDVDLNNVQNSTYTGIWHTTLTLSFYPVGPGVPAAAHPDSIIAVNNYKNSGVDGYFALGDPGQRGSAQVTFPRNMTRLKAELFAQGHGPCEEFWWDDPSQCGVSTPYREVAVYLDGRLAGAAPVYPVVFTGGEGPGLWEPIPSPRAWNLKPYVVDLSPFAGTLTDSLPHTVALGVFDTAYASGDYWLTGANLLAWTSPDSSATVGALTSAVAPAAPTESGGWDPSGNALYQYQGSHSLTFTGWVKVQGSTVTTTVTDSMSASSTETAAVVQTSWTSKTASTTTTSGPGQAAQTTSSVATNSFSITNEILVGFQFTDQGTTSDAVAGNQVDWTSYTEQMSTAAVGLAANGAERETYGASDSTGFCYDRALTAVAGSIVGDMSDSNCPAAPPPS